MDNKKEEEKPSAEGREKEEPFQKSKDVEEDNDAGDEEEVDADVEECDGRDDDIKKDKSPPWIADNIEEQIKFSVQPKEKKNSEGLNLNNEVVKMRKEVKRVRALIIRKLARQCGALKKRKGKEIEIEKNQRRAARLLEEIHALKALAPDLVTKRALQKNLNFEQVCKNPKSTISDRAISRIATHPQFKKKIEDIKAAVKTFKEERMKGGGQTGKEKVQIKARKVIPQPPAKKEEEITEKVEEVSEKGEKMIVENKEVDASIEDNKATTSTVPGMKTKKATSSADKVGHMVVMSKSMDIKPAIYNKGKDIVKNKPETPTAKSAPEGTEKKKDVEESDLESSDEEDAKEYFDDSTEERFYKQSSHSEESDGDDDFFIGKISRFKKKKKSAAGGKSHEITKDARDDVESNLGKFESRQKSKTTPLQSVFCSLSASKPGSDRERNEGRFRGRGKPRGGSGSKDYSKQSKNFKQEKETERNSRFNFTKSAFPEKGFHSISRGRGRGRGAVSGQKDHMGGSLAKKQPLHPSWEASKKRKAQQGQILAFQGKKIKFDDDD